MSSESPTPANSTVAVICYVNDKTEQARAVERLSYFSVTPVVGNELVEGMADSGTIDALIGYGIREEN